MSNGFYTPPTDIAAVTKALSVDINNIDAAVDAAFDKLPTEDRIKRGTINFAVDTGSADAYLVALPYVPSGYVDGLEVNFRPLNTNTGAATINVNSLGVKSLKRADGSDLSAGDITVGSPVMARYSTETGYFHMNGSSSVDAATTAVNAAATAADRIQTGLDRTAASDSATNAHNSELAAAASAASIAGGPVASVNGRTGVVTGVQDELVISIVSGTSQTAVAGTHYILTNVAATTVTLPAYPSSGDTVWVTWTNTLATNVIARNGETIMGSATDMTLDAVTNGTVQLRFVNSSWRIL